MIILYCEFLQEMIVSRYGKYYKPDEGYQFILMVLFTQVPTVLRSIGTDQAQTGDFDSIPFKK